MPGTFFGQVTVGGAVVGLSTGFNALGVAFQDMRATVAEQVIVIDAAVGELESQVQILDGIGELVVALGATIADVKAAIRLPVGGGIDQQLLAQGQTIASLGVAASNPAAYVAAKLAGAAQAVTNIGAVLPTVQIAGQLTAAGVIALQLRAKVAALDAALAVLDGPIAQAEAQGRAIAEAAAAIQATLEGISVALDAVNVAVQAADVALAQFVALSAVLGTTGAYALLYSGPLSDFGVEMNAALATTGVAPGTAIYAPIAFVLQADGAAVSAVDLTYRTS